MWAHVQLAPPLSCLITRHISSTALLRRVIIQLSYCFLVYALASLEMQVC